MCLLINWMLSSEKCLFRSSIFWLPFFVVVWLLSFTNCLCILEIKLLSVTLFANTSSKSTGSFFVLFMISFGGSDGKESTCDAGDLGSIPGLRRSPGGGHGNPLQYSCLENPMNGGAWGLQSMGLQRVGINWETKNSSENYLLNACFYSLFCEMFINLESIPVLFFYF